jgi:hypothetical protein
MRKKQKLLVVTPVTPDKEMCKCGHMMREHTFSRFECYNCDCQRVEIKGLLP